MYSSYRVPDPEIKQKFFFFLFFLFFPFFLIEKEAGGKKRGLPREEPYLATSVAIPTVCIFRSW